VLIGLAKTDFALYASLWGYPGPLVFFFVTIPYSAGVNVLPKPLLFLSRRFLTRQVSLHSYLLGYSFYFMGGVRNNTPHA
jgi:hypothetical protein